LIYQFDLPLPRAEIGKDVRHVRMTHMAGPKMPKPHNGAHGGAQDDAHGGAQDAQAA